ncbi:hypothetical protein LI99_07245 [Mycolicibacterium smegmatis]|uniref:Uncharacterized protein n=1 Tax=Mycolicibacterium smegmatis (strain ATCC 700084 / mc(2)155) TaxID=246196 RepID=I7FGC4_MYCS2|nr:hypothetical protein MSMEI_1415 [Mycolicibacterium smegmatis MC2 155]AIU06686.1 hypothetical protein LJ00_07245 [Mycolicibacterium smegmatis MC2 155]AIU13311.1 hypothetical protein LI99_07245 [Mycolicibacterium smegmatis]AIU19935.1 hypothetical protein LI98_07245 [Mycolicibacterium smegmatis]
MSPTAVAVLYRAFGVDAVLDGSDRKVLRKQVTGVCRPPLATPPMRATWAFTVVSFPAATPSPV